MARNSMAGPTEAGRREGIIAKIGAPVSRHSTRNLRKKDMDPQRRPKALPQILKEIAETSSPIFCRATDYPAGWHVEPHSHRQHQLIYAVRGVMVVQTGIWMMAGMTHEIRCVEEVHMRSLLVEPDAATKLPDETRTVGISPLLRELIRAAVDMRQPYVAGTRDGRVMRLILDELRALPVLPLHLQMPSDSRLLRICERLQQRLNDSSTMADWAKRLAVDVKTIQRLFVKETGMTFGQWRQQARLLRALELLATGEKVIEVALALGYESPGAFATMFRKQFGQTPSQFFAEQ
jgi:AraC-like DNA-binding protein